MKLEDTHLDVLTKAQKAQGMTDRDLAKLAQVSIPELNSIRSGGREPAALERLARTLGLRAVEIADLANGNWHAPTVALPPGVAMFTTPFADMTVNHFLIWDPTSLKAVAVDAGTDADALLACLDRHKLTLVKILLTHSHGDHVLELDRIREKTKAPAFSPEAEPVEGCKSVKNGQAFKVGCLSIRPIPFRAIRLVVPSTNSTASKALWPRSAMSCSPVQWAASVRDIVRPSNRSKPPCSN